MVSSLEQTDLEAAVDEARTVERLGGLDHQTILDIAHDYNVSAKELYSNLELVWPE